MAVLRSLVPLLLQFIGGAIVLLAMSLWAVTSWSSGVTDILETVRLMDRLASSDWFLPVVAIGGLVLMLAGHSDRLMAYALRTPLFRIRILQGEPDYGESAKLAISNHGGRTARQCSVTVVRLYRLGRGDEGNTIKTFAKLLPISLKWMREDGTRVHLLDIPNNGIDRVLLVARPTQQAATGYMFDFVSQIPKFECGPGCYRATIVVSSSDDRAVRKSIDVVLTAQETQHDTDLRPIPRMCLLPYRRHSDHIDRLVSDHRTRQKLMGVTSPFCSRPLVRD